MIGVAAILSANGMELIDGPSSMVIRTIHGVIDIPKDYLSDALRLQEALVEKCPVLADMLVLPKISGNEIFDRPNICWAFKRLWDARDVQDTYQIWGGDFQTYAEDHLDDKEEFVELDIDVEEHYYNVCLSNRDVGAFMEKNPEFEIRECDKACMKRAHKHAIHSFYKGGALECGTIAVWECAPPLRLHPLWDKLSIMVDNYVHECSSQEPKKDKKDKAAKNASKKSRSVDDDIFTGYGITFSKWEGAQTFNVFRKDPESTWTKVTEYFKDPKTARWASSLLAAKSKSHQKRLKVEWNILFFSKIVPLLKGEGSPMRTVMDAIWNSDQTNGKILSCYLMRRLMEGGFQVFSYERDQVEWVAMCEQ